MSLLLLAARARLNRTPANYMNAILANSPAVYWRLDETTGTSASDSSGNGRTGTYNGTVTLGVTGLIGGGAVGTAAQFGTGGYLRASGSGPSSIGDFSAEIWVKLSDATARNADALARSNEAYASTSLPCGIFLAVRGSGAKPRLGLRKSDGGGFESISATTGVADGNRHLVTFTRNATTGAAKIYIDGVSAISGTLSAGPIAVGASSAWMSRRFWNGGGGFVTEGGAADVEDEIAIYHAELTSAQVATHWNAGK